MTLKELELFFKLSENPHVSQLAKELGISQSAVSLAIKSLENKLTEPLFDRIGKKLILNERGRSFKDKSYKHFLILKDLENLFKEDKFFGVLKIASSKTIGNFIMPQLIFDFLLKYPNIKIEKDIKNSLKIIDFVKAGQIDIGFIEMDYKESDLFMEEMVEDNLIIVSSDKNLSQKSYYIDQLFLKKWIMREKGSGTRQMFLDILSKLNIKLDIFMEFTEFEEMKTVLLKNKDTITCVSRYVVESELERKELFEVKLINFELKRKFFCIYNKNKYKSILFKAFKSFVKKNL